MNRGASPTVRSAPRDAAVRESEYERLRLLAETVVDTHTAALPANPSKNDRHLKRMRVAKAIKALDRHLALTADRINETQGEPQ